MFLVCHFTLQRGDKINDALLVHRAPHNKVYHLSCVFSRTNTLLVLFPHYVNILAEGGEKVFVSFRISSTQVGPDPVPF